MANKIKGDKYEEYICNYLNSFKNKIAYLWRDVPEQLLFEANLITDYNQHRLKRKNNDKINPLQDIGIDIVFIKNHEFYFVQCKDYTNTIPVSDLAGFFMVMKQWENFIGEYTIYFNSNDEIWNKNLKLVKKYVNDNHKLPPQRDKNGKIVKLGKWVTHQQENYTKKINSMKDKKNRKKWKKFIEENWNQLKNTYQLIINFHLEVMKIKQLKK